MKRFTYYTIFILTVFTFSCKKVTDLYPQSNLNTGTYYSSFEEVKAALLGCYNGLQKPMVYEWQLTELRSDNSKQGVTGSTSSVNRDLSDLDMFQVSPSHNANTQFWLTTYNNIRNINIVLDKLGVVYDPATAAITINPISIPMSAADRKQLIGEALYLRAYHYFNLVRLYGGVFLIHTPITAAQAKLVNRSPVADIYKLIEVDLRTALINMNTLKFNQIPAVDMGRANGWAAKTLLAKMLLTLNRKADAIPLLQDVKDNSGYALQSNYANIFSVTNEMNSEIIFAVRYKAPGLGLGSPFANFFAPLSSGSAVVIGDGDGLNYPTAELDTLTRNDGRKSVVIATYGTGTATKLYTKKFLSVLTVTDDAENDWPVIRFADVLLMLAEAQGYSQSSIDLINLLRPRATLSNYTIATLNTVAKFEEALSNERRIEFAFENQRWFDLIRFNTTLTTLNAEQILKNHFANEYQSHYRLYTAPALTLAQLQANVTKDHLLLPIPQREIDTNTSLVIPQNPGY